MTDKKVWSIVGADAIGLVEQIGAFRHLSTSLALDDPQPTGNRR